MKRQIEMLSIAAVMSLMAEAAIADPIDLFDHSYNIDGVVSEIGLGDPVPGNVDESAFDDLSGLGTVEVTVSGAGAHSVLAFFDHEIVEGANTFFNEFAFGNNSPAPGQTAEADEPGFFFGDIYDNFLDNTLCNCTDVTAATADDVSMAMGWDFVLGGGETALVSFILSDINDSAGAFVVTHADLDSPDRIFFWGSLDIQGGGPGPMPVPEPGTVALFGIGLAGMGLMRRRRKV